MSALILGYAHSKRGEAEELSCAVISRKSDTVKRLFTKETRASRNVERVHTLFIQCKEGIGGPGPGTRGGE